MFPFYPFMYEEKKDDEFQQIPLYIEDIYYPLEQEEKKEKETVIVIDLL
jgi:hypothetical protein